MTGALLDWALETFAGYVAADALSEGPSCVLSAVDNRQDKRMLSAVRDHDPNHADITALLRRLNTALDERELTLHGMTTEGSALSPAPLRHVCGDVPHQLWTLHVITELTQGVVKAVAHARARLATSTPTLPRGRPSSQDQDARRLARQSTSMQQQIRDVFQERFLCVQRHLTPSERTRFLPMTRGVPHLRTLREIMEDIDALCDRRCRTQTALGTLQQLRQWVSRCTWIGET